MNDLLVSGIILFWTAFLVVIEIRERHTIKTLRSRVSKVKIKLLLTIAGLIIYYYILWQFDLMMSHYLKWGGPYEPSDFYYIWHFYLIRGDVYNICMLFLLFVPTLIESIWIYYDTKL